MILNVDFVKCPICNKEYKDLSHHIRNFHNLSINDYYKKFSEYPLICKNTINKIKNTKKNSKDERSKKAKLQFLNGERKIPLTNGKGLGGFRKDLNSYFRCMCEANFARILQLKNIEYVYEVKIPLYSEYNELIYTYVPDFYLPKFNSYIEIKGKWEIGAKEKIELFKKQYPNIKFVIIDGNIYKKLFKIYYPIISLWEHRDQNIKTHPQLYKGEVKNKSFDKIKLCPICNGGYKKMNLHFTKQINHFNCELHKNFYEKQKNIVINLYDNLDFDHKNLLNYGIIFNFDFCNHIWNSYISKNAAKIRANKKLSYNNEIKRNREFLNKQ